MDECKAKCEQYNVTEDYYRDYQCSGTFFLMGGMGIRLLHRFVPELLFCFVVLCSFFFIFFKIGLPAAITYKPEWRKYGIDHSSVCNLIHYWGEPQLARSSDYSFHTRALGDCHDGVLIDEKCYRLSEDFEGNVTWETASTECQAWGGYLAVFESEAEAISIARTVRPLRDGARWVGLSSIGDCTGTFHWANYAQVNLSASYLDFVGSSPTDIEDDAHCVSVRQDTHTVCDALNLSSCL